MARYTGPKHKLSRREGVNLTGTRSRSLERRLRVPPGQHATARPRRPTEYGRQLREKQKLKRHFGMLEKQFRHVFEEAERAKEPTGAALLSLLEQRLDSVVYRLGFAPTRPMARQLVNHGHVLVNGRRVNIPSYRVPNGATIQLTPKAADIPSVQEALTETSGRVPSWLSRNGNTAEGRVVGIPTVDEFDMPVDVELVIAFYTR